MNIEKRYILFGIKTLACLFTFVAICVSVGFSHTPLIFINGVFYIIYFLSLWNTVMDTFELYDKKYFIVDMLSIAVYVNIPRLFILEMPINQFFVYFWILFVLNEAVCIGWDLLSHFNAKNEKAKNFFSIWTMLTFVGIILMVISIMFIYTEVFQKHLVLINMINIVYQLSLLLAWWISKYCIEQKSIKQ